MPSSRHHFQQQGPGLPAKASTIELGDDVQVRDAGRTEVAAGSVTVAAIGGQSEIVDQVTGQLRTL